MRKTALAASAAFVIASGAMAMPASAADLDFFEPAPPVFVPTWEGFYFGGHVGFGEADVRIRQSIFVEPPIVDTDDVDVRRTLRPDGLLGGVQAGYNWQMDSLVFGIEGDISFLDWRHRSTVFHVEDELSDAFSTGTARADVDFLASVRGRLGFAMDSLLIYGTGGIAWADASARATIVTDDTDEVRTFTGRRNLNDVGFVLGGGASWMVIPQTFSIGVEGLFYFFDKRRTLIDAEFRSWDTWDVDVRADARLEDIWVLRLRGDLHF